MGTAKKALATTDDSDGAALERVLIEGDLSKLTPEQRVTHYVSVCESVGLNYKTSPFAYITLNNKLTLYALKGATDQLRSVNNVSLEVVDKSLIGDCLSVTVRATSNGRTDEDTGVVSIKGLYGEALANSHMKAITKGKRRVTLSICGLGMLDESEAETIPGAVVQPGPVAKLVNLGSPYNGIPVREDDEPEPRPVTKAGPDDPGRLAMHLNKLEGLEDISEVDALGVVVANDKFMTKADRLEFDKAATVHVEFLGGA